ncbi:polyprotein [Goose pegivirus 2]|nr:polyprotein [Goose pegivirus 2]
MMKSSVLLVVLALLCLSGSGGGWKLAAEHACWNETLGEYQITNCCDQSEVFYCFADACVVAHGCVICTSTECWELRAAGVSSRPNTTRLRSAVRDHVGAVLVTAYICEGLGVGEFCSGVFLVYQGYRMWGGWHLDLRCDRDCAMRWSGQVEGMWDSPIGDALSVVVSLVLGVPRAIWAAIEDGGGILALFILLYLLEERPFRALLVLAIVMTQYHTVNAQNSLGRLVMNSVWRSRATMKDYEPCHYYNGTWVEESPWDQFSRPNTNKSWFCGSGWFFRKPTNWTIIANGKALGPRCGRNLTVEAPAGEDPWIVCVYGSVWTYARRGNHSGPIGTKQSSTCYVRTSKAHSIVHTCVVDKRERWCGNCTRDCWPETGSPLFDFKRCGVGTRLTKYLDADPRCTWNKTIGGWNTKLAEQKCRGYVLAEVDGRVHALRCPLGHDYTLPVYIPGKPVGRTRSPNTGWWPWGITLWGVPNLHYLREEYYNVCLGFAFRWEDEMDGLIHYNKVHNAGHQAVRGGVPPKGYFMMDFFIGVLIVTKLTGARWIPFIVLMVWVQLTPIAFARRLEVLPNGSQVLTYSVWWDDEDGLGAGPPDVLQLEVGGIRQTIRRGDPIIGELVVDHPSWLESLADVVSAVAELVRYWPAIVAWVVFGKRWAVLVLLAILAGEAYAAPANQAHPWWNADWDLVDEVAAWRDSARWAFSSSGPLAEAWSRLTNATCRYFYCGRLGADAALPGWIATGPMLAAATEAESWTNAILVILNLIVYIKSKTFGRLASMVGFKLYRGWFLATFVGLVGWSRRRHSVLGSECEICFKVAIDGGLDFSWSVAIILSYALLVMATFNSKGKCVKLGLYARWAYWYGKVHDWLLRSPLGVENPGAGVLGVWWVVSLLYPRECLCVIVWLYTILGLIDTLDMAFEAALVVEPDLPRWARTVETLAEARNLWGVKRLLEVAGRAGVHLYDHMGQVGEATRNLLLETHACLEPAYVTKQDLEVIRDDQFVLACGSVYGGKPVVARMGENVLIGHARSQWTIPPGYKLSAPLLLRREGKNAYRVLLTSMRGRDDGEYPGQIIRLGTALTRSFGTCVEGLMYTTFHSCDGRSIATADGSVYPRWVTASEDVAAFPMPKGARCLETCSCSTVSGWAMTREGSLVHGKLTNNMLMFDTDRRLGEFKGSSGSPILCDHGHCLGMLVAVQHAGPRVHSARFVRPWQIRPRDAVIPTAEHDLPLPGKDYRVEGLVAPTGSGKSTRIPAEYVKLGYKVVVVNPSVATTAAMLKYIPEAFKINPSVYAGHGPGAVSVSGSADLTYCTYGRLIASDFQLIKGADVVVLDECHSTDSTSILGIGGVLTEAPTLGVKLVMLATATPPGAQVSSHPNIEEEQLGDEGDIPFYGVTLESAKYTQGRHLIFCHSKAECERVALALTKFRVKVVTYYRGKQLNVIPATGDVVVCATDALSTGYTGNFDTVTDCCSFIEESVDVDLSPTVTISVRTKPVHAALRLQRRGRTGRGKRGTYRYVVPESIPVGTAPSGAIWQAAETGVLWFNLSERRLTRYLEAYRDSPWTCVPECGIADPVAFFLALRKYRSSPEVLEFQSKNYNWPLLSGVQLKLCKELQAGPPSKDDRWKKLEANTAPVPLIARWAGSDPEVQSHELVTALQEALGVPAEVLSSGPALLVGAAVACAAALVNYTGCLVPIAAWTVGTAADGHLSVSDFVIEDALTAVETCVSWDACVDGMNYLVNLSRDGVAAAVRTAKGWWGPIPAAKESWALVLARLINSWASGITGGVAILTSRSSPILASFSMFASGMMACLKPEVHVVVGALAGGLTTMIADPGAGLAVAGAFVAGGLAGSLTSIGQVAAGISGWEAAVTGAHLVFAGLNGTISKELLARGLVCLASPGAAVAGGVIGAVLYHASSGKSTVKWTNRILSAVPRTSVLPDDFFESGDPKEKVEAALNRLSLVELVKRLLASLSVDGVTECAGNTVWELVGDLLYWVRSVIDWLVGVVKAQFPRVGIPIVHCQSPYRGGWKGSGTVVSKCPCGNQSTLQINEGRVTWRNDTRRLCRSALLGGVPINAEGSARGPVPLEAALEGGVIARYPYGLSDWIEVQYTAAGPVLYATTTAEVSRTGLLASLRHQPTMVAGVSRSWRNYHTACAMTFTEGAVILYSGSAVKLPHHLQTDPQVNRDPGRGLEPADAPGADVPVIPEPAPSVLSVEPGEPANPIVSFKGGRGLRKAPVNWDFSVPNDWGDVWVSPGMTVRQFKHRLAGITGHKVPIRVKQLGCPLRDNELLPVTDFTVEIVAEEPTTTPQTTAADVAADIKPMGDLPGQELHETEKLLNIHLNCCGTSVVIGMPWHAEYTLLEICTMACERDMYWISCGYHKGDTTYRPWTKRDFLAHTPVLDGQKVSWSAIKNRTDLSSHTSNTLKLLCNHPQKWRGVKKGDEAYSLLSIFKARMRCPWRSPDTFHKHHCHSACKKGVNCEDCREYYQSWSRANGGWLPMAGCPGDTYSTCMFPGEYDLRDDHHLTIDGERVLWSSTMRSDDALKKWEIHCDHPDLEEFDDCETVVDEDEKWAGSDDSASDYETQSKERIVYTEKVEMLPGFGSEKEEIEMEALPKEPPPPSPPVEPTPGPAPKHSPPRKRKKKTKHLESSESLEMENIISPKPAQMEIADPAGEARAAVTVSCCSEKKTEISLRPGKSWLETIMAHLGMQGKAKSPDAWRKHKLRVNGVATDWDQGVVTPTNSPVVDVTADCEGLCLVETALDVTREVTLDIACCGVKSRKTHIILRDDSVEDVLNMAGLTGSLHHIRWNGRAYYPHEAFPQSGGDVCGVVCGACETKCVQSYVWSGAPLGLRELTRRPPTTSMGGLLRANPTRAYRTDPAQIGERISTVTREQVVAREDKYLLDAYNCALAKASRVRSWGYTYEEAISKVRPRAAPGHNVKLTVPELKTERGKAVVLACLEDIKARRGDHPFCIAAKQEVFPMTKKTKKPPRIICYPSLEFRVAEKMILGDPGRVARAVVGKAYGFVSPKERCARMLEMWRSKKHPMAITVDAKVFDSTITREDVARETEIYAAASDDPDAVRALGERYASGLMVNPKGVIVGQRNCRASGVLTTSSSNTITSYIKVSAACRAVGVPDPSFLIAGDDCLIVCEECDVLNALKAKLAEYGYMSDPSAHGSLSTAETCSTYMGEAYTDRKEYFLSTNMERAIARACSEWSDPVAVAGGYTLLYPWHPIARYLLIVQLLWPLFKSGKTPDEQVVCDVVGNTVRFPLRLLPAILVGLHGPGCLRVRSDSAKTLEETHRALQIMGCRGLSWYKSRWRNLRRALLQDTQWAKLAYALMWEPNLGKPYNIAPLELDSLQFLEQRYQGFSYTLLPQQKKKTDWLGVVGLGILAVLTVFCPLLTLG